jgi:hypothetical protein
MLLKIDIDLESLTRLAEIAALERRPVSLQAEVLLLQSLGRWPLPEPAIVNTEDINHREAAAVKKIQMATTATISRGNAGVETR